MPTNTEIIKQLQSCGISRLHGSRHLNHHIDLELGSIQFYDQVIKNDLLVFFIYPEQTGSPSLMATNHPT